MIENSEYKHLKENIVPFLQLSDKERISKIRTTRWIGYTRALQILNRLEDLLSHPKTHRMPNLLIVGDTNNGKTMIVNRFDKKHPPSDNPDGDGITMPVFIIQAPPIPDEARFYNSILSKVFSPYKTNDRTDKKQFQVISILKRINLKMLIIDEIHHIIAGTLNKQRQFLNTIKHLGNELKIPIVGVGTLDAFNALSTDPQLSNRFEPVSLSKWKNNEEYLKLLTSFEKLIPLKYPSNLTEEKLSLKILTLSEGTIGEISSLLSRAAVKAVETKVEKINASLLDSIGWVIPSERKWKADKSG